jgi:hypothetical protein
MSRLSTKQRRARRKRRADHEVEVFLHENPWADDMGLMYWPESVWPAVMRAGRWPGVKGGRA